MSLYCINAKTFVRLCTRNRCAGRLRAMLRLGREIFPSILSRQLYRRHRTGLENGSEKKKIINKINLNTYVNKLISCWATPGESTPLTGYIDHQTFIINFFSTYERDNRSNTVRFD